VNRYDASENRRSRRDEPEDGGEEAMLALPGEKVVIRAFYDLLDERTWSPGHYEGAGAKKEE
jgi:hypothetical protein